MSIVRTLEEQGWELVPRRDWTAVQEKKIGFKKISPTGRVGKIVGSHFYVTVTQLGLVTRALIEEAGAKPNTINSTSGNRNAEYVGFDTLTVTAERLSNFAARLRIAVDDLLASQSVNG